MVAKESPALLALTAALLFATVPVPTEAQPAEPRIDGSSAARFETSVVSLRNELPARRREDLDVALAIIWARNTAGSDFDGDGDMDLDDMRLLEAYADDLLTNIRRGNVVSAIEDRAGSGEYTTADYFAELDGLSYDEVVELGGLADAKSYLAAVQSLGLEDQCASSPQQSSGRIRRCEGFSRPQSISPRIGAALNDAIMALNARNYGAARDAIVKLPLERLTSYERGKAEQTLYWISVGEGNYAQAREHLVASIESGGLTAPEVADALRRIGIIDGALPAVAAPAGSNSANDEPSDASGRP